MTVLFQRVVIPPTERLWERVARQARRLLGIHGFNRRTGAFQKGVL